MVTLLSLNPAEWVNSPERPGGTFSMVARPTEEVCRFFGSPFWM